MQNLIKGLTVCLLLCIAFSLSAQFSIGPKIGVNFTKWNTTTEGIFEDSESRLRYQVGITTDFSINKLLALQTEFLVIRKGGKQKIQPDSYYGYSSDVSTIIDISYLEIPILLKFKFGEKEGNNFYFNTGTSIGYGLKGRKRFDEDNGYNYYYGYYGYYGNDDFSNFNVKWENDNSIKRLDISLALGAGATIHIGEGNLLIEARLLYGLTNLFADIPSSEDVYINNVGIGLTVGYLLPL